MAESTLKTYRGKRNFDRTPEPQGSDADADGTRFVVHKHSATADHYDLRLEVGGVLKSWAVPKGPSLNPEDKRFAVETEDHPLEYIDFEGVIPEGEYGGGPMIVWDQGTWAPMDDIGKSLKSGAFKFRLVGEKLKGGWMLARLKKKPDETKQAWLLIKEHDLAVDRENDILVERPESVKSGRRIEELVAPPIAEPVALRPGKLKRAVKAPVPASLAPQLATSVAAPPTDTDNRHWLHEIKLDGYRTMAFVEDGVARLITRSGLDWTKRYGDLPAAFAQLRCKSAVIDGEIVVLDERGVSSFAALQDALANKAGHHLIFYAFDLVYFDGWDLTKVRLDDRKGLMAQLLAGHLTGRSAIQLSDHIAGDPAALHERVSEMGLEGLVSKRADAPYVSGRTDTWQKVKALNIEEFAIAGYTRSPAGGLGALALAEWVDGELHYRGKCGTGFDAEELQSLLARLEPLEGGGEPLEGGPKEIRWVRPVLTVRVHYANRTTDGRLRHAVYRGLREAELSRPAAAPRKRLISDADLAGIWVTNPTRRMFGKSGPTKLDIAIYYAAVGDFMLPHLFNRPVSLVRCPTGKPQDCFFQRHAFTGMPPTVESFETKNSEGETQTYLTVEGVKGYLALAQFGVVEFHTWGTHRRHLDKPDQIVLDLDPGEGIGWREVVEAAVHIRGELEAMGLEPFVKTSGGRGLHVVLPLVPGLDWKQTHKVAGTLAKRLADTAPDTFTTVMGASNRKRRIFIDFHRNARSATAAAAYTLRARVHLPASTPLHWADLESIDGPSDLNYSSLPGLLNTSGDPWAEIDDHACEIPEALRGRV